MLFYLSTRPVSTKMRASFILRNLSRGGIRNSNPIKISFIYRMSLSSLGNPMFPHRPLPELTPDLINGSNKNNNSKNSNSGNNDGTIDDFMNKYGWKAVTFIGLSAAIYLFYSFYKNGQLRHLEEESLFDEVILEPEEINELKSNNFQLYQSITQLLQSKENKDIHIQSNINNLKNGDDTPIDEFEPYLLYYGKIRDYISNTYEHYLNEELGLVSYSSFIKWSLKELQIEHDIAGKGARGWMIQSGHLIDRIVYAYYLHHNQRHTTTSTTTNNNNDSNNILKTNTNAEIKLPLHALLTIMLLIFSVRAADRTDLLFDIGLNTYNDKMTKLTQSKRNENELEKDKSEMIALSQEITKELNEYDIICPYYVIELIVQDLINTNQVRCMFNYIQIYFLFQMFILMKVSYNFSLLVLKVCHVHNIFLFSVYFINYRLSHLIN